MRTDGNLFRGLLLTLPLFTGLLEEVLQKGGTVVVTHKRVGVGQGASTPAARRPGRGTHPVVPQAATSDTDTDIGIAIDTDLPCH